MCNCQRLSFATAASLYIFFANSALTLCFTTEDTASWTGRWFPEKPSSLLNHEKAKKKNDTGSMGMVNPECDDAKSNLSVDWDGSFGDYICMNPRGRIFPNASIHSIIEYENIPKTYTAPHFCMQKFIEYRSPLPTFGPHRPLWPKYGEYKFVPKQRWIHSLEHGGIVALYHPCADVMEIRRLKKLVKGCLRRHVITPSRDLGKNRPYALLAWGVRFTMAVVDPFQVRRFIEGHALRGPEKLADEGQYEHMLIKQSTVVSDYEDSILCPDSDSPRGN